ncbi:proheparin-binding EGF-like growth factor isoform X3 [Bufo gargarizans]|uniref:proheparin-binding EGF-like growth factor isoform X3 n=1 Tax=Bufo gargarizans TaxID=30331 RepID=UPI001CF43FC9|nr:proheparin-binding EGF-like growth factor isoform X3 [Bufo gargarizans]
MKFLKLLLLLAVKGLIAVIHGAVIDPFDVLQKPTNELERPGLHEKPQATGGNLIIASSRAAHSSKSKDAQREEKIHNVRKKGKGLKRDPCLRKYKDFCFHGTCRFLKVTKDPYCVTMQAVGWLCKKPLTQFWRVQVFIEDIQLTYGDVQVPSRISWREMPRTYPSFGESTEHI